MYLLPPPARITIAELIAAGAQFDLLYIDPQRQIAALDEFYLNGAGTLDRCLRIHEVMAPSSAAFIATRIRDLGVVTTELLPRCGFSRPWGIFPLTVAKTADLGNVRALVVAKRGEVELPPRDHDFWRDAPSRLAPIEMVESLSAAGERKLQAFADMRLSGWTTLIGDDSWIEPPTFTLR